MNAKVNRKYTVSDVYKEAGKMLKDEMQSMKRRPLSKTEEVKMQELAKALSQGVLKEMKLI
jgi:hypothetical protein